MTDAIAAAALLHGQHRHPRPGLAGGAGEVTVEVDDRMQAGHVALPNGLGVDHPDEDGRPVVTGLAPNELTTATDRDPWAGTPWHKHVPARLEPVAPVPA